jgi:hypothetical protein
MDIAYLAVITSRARPKADNTPYLNRTFVVPLSDVATMGAMSGEVRIMNAEAQRAGHIGTKIGASTA